MLVLLSCYSGLYYSYLNKEISLQKYTILSQNDVFDDILVYVGF